MHCICPLMTQSGHSAPVAYRGCGATRANLSIRPAQSLFPEFDYSRRKFTPSDSGASAGFRPHLKQGVIFTEQVALRNLVSFRTRPSLGCHFQELDERSDILVMGVHDKPLRNVGDLTHNNTGCRCVGHHERRISAQAVMNYFSLIRILLYNGNGHGGFSGDP